MNLADRVRANSRVTALLDCDGICHALRHAAGNLSHNGKETGIIFGFLLQLFVLQKRFHPDRWVFAWDSRYSLRRKIYPQYKNNRAARRSKDEWHWQFAFQQFDLLRQGIIPQLGLGEWNLYWHGYEADDLIASAAEMIEGRKIIVSQDRDFYQLLARDCSMYNSRTQVLFTEADFRRQYGVGPEQWVDVKAIAGCLGDGVKGVPGVGEATAIKYLTGQLPCGSKTYMKIAVAGDAIGRDRRLVKLPFDGFRISIEGKSPGASRMSGDGFRAVCEEYGFDSFLSEQKFHEWGILFGWKR